MTTEKADINYIDPAGVQDDQPLAGTQVAVARQPIVDLAGSVVGFELLYRPVAMDDPRPGGEQMTALVVLSALGLGIDHLVGRAAMFCNAERDVIVGHSDITLPPERTVIELLETTAVDDEVVAGCRRLIAAGFRIALDDFVWRDGAERLLELASVVKIDVQAVSRADIPELITRCRPYDVALLAEKVETQDDIDFARGLGFELFQGYAIERPAIVRGHVVATSTLGYVQLAATVLAESLDFAELEEILRHEPGLVVQVLEVAATSDVYGLRRRVRSVREALVLLGSIRLRRWLAVILLGDQPGCAPDAMATALQRARMVETLTRARGIGSSDVAFTAGMLSCIDLLLGVELDRVPDLLQLAPELVEAAFERTGPIGDVVAEVVAYQAGLGSTDSRQSAAGDLDVAAAEAFVWVMTYLAAR